jgi:NADPH2:quinone reductase
MQAIVVQALGDPSVLTLRSHPIPDPGPGEVLVRIEAAGVNFTETEKRRGVYNPPALPWIPGDEGAGVVEATGQGVDRSWTGRRVAFWARAPADLRPVCRGPGQLIVLLAGSGRVPGRRGAPHAGPALPTDWPMPRRS